MAQSSRNLEGCAIADEELAVARRRHRTGCVVGVGAGANHRAVADPAGHLTGYPAGRGRGGEIALAVAGDGTYGTGPGRGRRAPGKCALQFPPALLGAEVAELLKGDVLLAAEGEGALSDQQYMVRVFHHGACRQYRVARSEDTGHRARPVIPPVHHRSVHLLASRNSVDAASAGVEQRVVFEGDNRLRHGIERIAPGSENVAADL